MIKFFLKTLAITFAGIIIGLVFYNNKLPELSIWHSQILESDFNTESSITTFEAYLKLENSLFSELNEKIITRLPASEHTLLNRFVKGSLSHPGASGVNWNKSFILPTQSPKAGILLLHGMSDSPYSLRNIGTLLNKKGALVVGLRLPGHGTAPSGLLDIKWEDMAASVSMAVDYIAKEIADKPIYIIGYSTGAALGLQYTLSTLNNTHLKKISGLVQISPAIGVSKIAAAAKFLGRISHLTGLEKLSWNSVIPEYNPYKYNSFTVNAGDQVYRLTKEINRQFAVAKKEDNLSNLPDIIAFQSITDATVSTAALVENLFLKLPKAGHELFIFDINRTFDLKPLIRKDPVLSVHNLFKKSNLLFTFNFITNIENETRDVYLHQKKQGDEKITRSSLDLTWPKGVYSLSHVALPFPDNDPLYGIKKVQGYSGINLGSIPLTGEKGILSIPVSEIIRLKWNPFYILMEEKISTFIF